MVLRSLARGGYRQCHFGAIELWLPNCRPCPLRQTLFGFLSPRSDKWHIGPLSELETMSGERHSD